MEETVNYEVENYEDAVASLEAKIEYGKKMKDLISQPDFIELFEEGFITSWAVTNAFNYANYDEATRKRVQEGLIARSKFTKHIETVIAQGNMAVKELMELKASQEEEENVGEEEE